ncbi:hypothetical protein [Vibrio ouci]|uniref:Uncharacterized protein n=1 Tax=Vibrio ouci TaxID=2499078 RepID=A0A4Y8WA26_9VIBR|nr:hypothetical protein [Vibrio ouci]TFH89506.1 hypothetical protein ELS82_21880 [Vibrio ouci]
MRIVYGICGSNIAELIGQPIDTESTILKVKALHRIGEHLIFAALINTTGSIFQPTVLPLCVIVKNQPTVHRAGTLPSANIDALKGRQRKKYLRKLKKWQPLTPENWTLHISRKLAIKCGCKFLEA